MNLLELASKRKKYEILIKNPELKDFIAETCWFNKRNLTRMFKKFNIVYVKPSKGTAGSGVIKVSKKQEGDQLVFSYHYRTVSKNFKTMSGLYKSLKRKINRIKNKRTTIGRYMIQQGIPLLTHQNRVSDIRVITQKNLETKKWEATGIVGRVAPVNKIITNYSSGGTPLRYEEIMSEYFSKEEIRNHRKTLEDLVIKMANSLSTKCPDLTILGFDIGYDQHYKPWLIEVNLMPRFKSFKVTDMNTYQLIQERFTGYPTECYESSQRKGNSKKRKKARLKRSKWDFKTIIEKHPELKQHVPETSWFNRESLKILLDKHEFVYVKPDNSAFGKGVMKVEKVTDQTGQEVFRYFVDTEVFSYETFEDLFFNLTESINKKMAKRKENNRKYLVQQGIRLLKHDGRIFDTRLTMVRNENKYIPAWTLSKVAHPEKVVTNIGDGKDGGDLYMVTDLLRQYMFEADVDNYLKKLYKIGEQIGPLFNRDRLGIDIGIDENFFPWIIEVNLWPDVSFYEKHKHQVKKVNMEHQE